MTFSELEEYVRTVKAAKKLPCNLFDENLKPGRFLDVGLYVEQNNDVWEVYHCERGNKDLLAQFYTKSDCYEYICSCYKEEADNSYWRWWHTLLLLAGLALLLLIGWWVLPRAIVWILRFVVEVLK